MKQINGLIILIGSFLFSSQSLAENNSEKIKNECQKVAQKMCGNNCIEPEEPETSDYPEWWSQAMKNKEWNKRIELKKQRKDYELIIVNQQPYIDYCIAKEEDLRKNQSLNAMVQQKHIKHENVFYNWNRYRLSEISSNTLTFNVIEKDREIYNKRYKFYKNNTFNNVKKSIIAFAEKSKINNKINLFEVRHKNVEFQNEFLSLIAEDLINFNSFFDAKTKLDKHKKLLEKSQNNKVENLILNELEYKMLVKYFELIERKDENSINKINEKYKIKVEKLEYN